MGSKLLEDGVSSFVDTIASGVKQQVNDALSEQIKRVDKAIAELDKAKPIVISYQGKTGTLPIMRHCQLESLLEMVGKRLDILIVGQAGTGKTHAARQVAEALSLPFYCQSVGAQTSKSDLLGYMDATGKYVQTNFRRAYEEGGVFVMDEIDAGNANVLIVLNSALSNDVCAFPDKMVERHPDFKFIATANTYGNGASREYVGRNQLDAATLDRFVLIDWKRDKKLEEKLTEPYTYGRFWCAFVRRVRDWVDDQGLKAIISPRTTVQGAILLQPREGELTISKDKFLDTIDSTILKSIPTSNHGQIKQMAKDYFAENYTEV